MRNRRPPSEVALAITLACRAQGLTQTELGERAGLSRPTVARLEDGVEGLSLANLYKVIDAPVCASL